MRNIVRNVKKNWRTRIKCSFKITEIVAGVIFFLDLFIKNHLSQNLSFRSIPVIKNIFHITVVLNNGAAFGILKGNYVFLICSSIIFIIVFLVFMIKEKNRGSTFLISCGMILGGALSNFYDRIARGFVVDYIDLRVWPVFNLSDSCISIGVILLCLQMFSTAKKNER